MSLKQFTTPRGAATILCVVLFGIGLAPRASADERDKKTIVTFSAPVEIPGKALPAGTYVFKLLDSTSNRNILQIFDKDEKHGESGTAEPSLATFTCSPA
jgi:hypothetical protein